MWKSTAARAAISAVLVTCVVFATAGSASAAPLPSSGLNAAPTTASSSSSSSSSASTSPAPLPLTVPDPDFTAGSWAPGIIFESSGFAPSSPVTLYLYTQTGPNTFTTETTVVNTDPKGNLSSVWTPSVAPLAPNSNGYPEYSVFAMQQATATSPTLLTVPASLSIMPAN